MRTVDVLVMTVGELAVMVEMSLLLEGSSEAVVGNVSSETVSSLLVDADDISIDVGNSLVDVTSLAVVYVSLEFSVESVDGSLVVVDDVLMVVDVAVGELTLCVAGDSLFVVLELVVVWLVFGRTVLLVNEGELSSVDVAPVGADGEMPSDDSVKKIQRIRK